MSSNNNNYDDSSEPSRSDPSNVVMDMEVEYDDDGTEAMAQHLPSRNRGVKQQADGKQDFQDGAAGADDDDGSPVYMHRYNSSTSLMYVPQDFMRHSQLRTYRLQQRKQQRQLQSPKKPLIERSSLDLPRVAPTTRSDGGAVTAIDATFSHSRRGEGLTTSLSTQEDGENTHPNGIRIIRSTSKTTNGKNKSQRFSYASTSSNISRRAADAVSRFRAMKRRQQLLEQQQQLLDEQEKPMERRGEGRNKQQETLASQNKVDWGTQKSPPRMLLVKKSTRPTTTEVLVAPPPLPTIAESRTQESTSRSDNHSGSNKSRALSSPSLSPRRVHDNATQTAKEKKNETPSNKIRNTENMNSRPTMMSGKADMKRSTHNLDGITNVRQKPRRLSTKAQHVHRRHRNPLRFPCFEPPTPSPVSHQAPHVRDMMMHLLAPLLWGPRLRPPMAIAFSAAQVPRVLQTMQPRHLQRLPFQAFFRRLRAKLFRSNKVHDEHQTLRLLRHLLAAQTFQ